MISLIMFPYPVAIIIFSIVGAIAAIPITKRIIIRRRRMSVRRQFKDFLDSVCNSFSGGCNADEAFARAFTDMKFSYGEKAVFVRLAADSFRELGDDKSVDKVLIKLAEKTEDSSVSAFAETFCVCLKSGGNLQRLASDSRDIINGKIEAEREIAVCISSNRNELNILSVMPFVIVLLMKEFGDGMISENSVSGIVSRIIAAVVIASAYIIGLKITDIKV